VGEAEWDAVLEPGDSLYVPRGDHHRAEVSSPLSRSDVQPDLPARHRCGSLDGAGERRRRVIRAFRKASAGPEGLLAQRSALRWALHRRVEELACRPF
jgi:hypothetical protein